MKRSFLILILSFCSCKNNSQDLSISFKLPKHLREVSGIAYSNEKMYLIEDGKNTNTIFELNSAGGIIAEHKIENVPNKDWEELTIDNSGNLYIGDFGNNDNIRKDLAIFKINSLNDNGSSASQKTSFYYPEQTEFPPKKKELLYDCEAFFEMNGNFYLFTKNRSKGFDGTMLIYKVPNKEGNFAARLIGKYKTGDDYSTAAITGAALSPDQSKFVLLSHSKIWLFEDFKGDDFLNAKITQLELNHYSQKEAICFKDGDTLLIADEKDKKTGGNSYEVSLKSLKSKP